MTLYGQLGPVYTWQGMSLRQMLHGISVSIFILQQNVQKSYFTMKFSGKLKSYFHKFEQHIIIKKCVSKR